MFTISKKFIKEHVRGEAYGETVFLNQKLNLILNDTMLNLIQMEQQIEIVNKIKQELNDIKKMEKEAYTRLEKEKHKLIELCSIRGHIFDRYGGYDGHRNDYYYTCRACSCTTSYRPDKWEKDYSC